MKAVNYIFSFPFSCLNIENILMKTICRRAGTLLILLLLFSGFLGAQNKVYTSNGTFVVPSGIVFMTVECWGAGGGGGGNTTNEDGGGGGGGGAYSRVILNVVPGTSYSIVVGTGGTGSTVDGSNGGDTWFGSPAIVLAKGGTGGYAPSGGTAGAGGTGGSSAAAAIGSVMYSGGNGGFGN
jgi:hypothetical protein